MDDKLLKAKGKRLVDENYDALLHKDLSPSKYLSIMKTSGFDTGGLTATKHITYPLRAKKAKVETSSKKLAKFNSEMIGGETGNDATEDVSDIPATTKTDYKIVDFGGEFNGISRRWGFCYINLHQGFKTTISYGANNQSLIVKIKKPGFYWKDLIHSKYQIPSQRYEDRDPYKLAIAKAFSPMEEVETLVVDIGEDIEEATDKKVEIKKSGEPEHTWRIHCVPFLYKDCSYDKEIELLE